jgi:hypothetical protein
MHFLILALLPLGALAAIEHVVVSCSIVKSDCSRFAELTDPTTAKVCITTSDGCKSGDTIPPKSLLPHLPTLSKTQLTTKCNALTQAPACTDAFMGNNVSKVGLVYYGVYQRCTWSDVGCRPKPEGKLVLCGDCPGIKQLAAK